MKSVKRMGLGWTVKGKKWLWIRNIPWRNFQPPDVPKTRIHVACTPGAHLDILGTQSTQRLSLLWELLKHTLSMSMKVDPGRTSQEGLSPPCGNVGGAIPGAGVDGVGGERIKPVDTGC